MGFISAQKNIWYAYRITKLEKFVLILVNFFLSIFLGWLFYEHYIGMIVAFIIIFVYLGQYSTFKKSKINKIIQEEFITINSLLLAELEGGMSLEKAIINIERRVRTDSALSIKIMSKELKQWIVKIDNGQNLEDLIKDFMVNVGDVTLVQYAGVLKMSRKQGANLLEVISVTNQVLREKSQMQREIEILISEKKFEQMIMSFMPFIMLFMLKTISYEFISPLYETLVGRFVMSILLIVFIGCYYWSYKMTVIL